MRVHEPVWTWSPSDSAVRKSATSQTRVAILTRDNPHHVRGGVETFSRNLQRVFPNAEVFAYGGAAGRRLLFNEARDARAAFRSLRPRLEPGSFDAVVANGCAAWPLGRDFATPVISVFHGTYAGFGRALQQEQRLHGLWTRLVGAHFERLAARGRAGVVAVSSRVAEEVKRHYGVEARVIVNAIESEETSRSKRDARAHLRLPAEGPLVAFVGRGTRMKGFDHLITLAKRRPSLTVAAAGVSQEEASETPVRALGSLDESDVRELYTAADVVVLPSRYEGCSYVPLEAMIADRPVVVSTTGSFEQPGRHEFGIAIPTDDAEALIVSVDRVLYDSSLRPREWVCEHHGFQRFARAWCELVSEVRGHD